jgi:hypothetical protein
LRTRHASKLTLLMFRKFLTSIYVHKRLQSMSTEMRGIGGKRNFDEIIFDYKSW